MNSIETFIRLKYPQVANYDEWQELYNAYPRVVRDNLAKRWINSQHITDYLSYNDKWELYIKYLFEELCKYELSQNEQ